jgi:hypothetical protein
MFEKTLFRCIIRSRVNLHHLSRDTRYHTRDKYQSEHCDG